MNSREVYGGEQVHHWREMETWQTGGCFQGSRHDVTTEQNIFFLFLNLVLFDVIDFDPSYIMTLL